MRLVQTTGKRGLGLFLGLMREAGIPKGEAEELARVAYQHIRHIDGKADPSPAIVAMEDRWYDSVRIAGKPDFGVYDEAVYLAEGWACWDVYSRKHIAGLTNPSIVHVPLAPGAIIVDLGNGIGMSSAALRQSFPHCEVYGTNVKPSPQWDMAEVLAKRFRFTMKERPSDCPKADLIFASEYFEHFPVPVAHLHEVVEVLEPKQMLLANAFSPDAIGHFDEYEVEGQTIPCKRMGRLFNDELRRLGYRKVETGFWNNRPAYWKRP